MRTTVTAADSASPTSVMCSHSVSARSAASVRSPCPWSCRRSAMSRYSRMAPITSLARAMTRARVIAYASGPPSGLCNLANGVTKNVQMNSGHRNWLVTECPSTRFYGDLPTLRKDIAISKTQIAGTVASRELRRRP